MLLEAHEFLHRTDPKRVHSRDFPRVDYAASEIFFHDNLFHSETAVDRTLWDMVSLRSLWCSEV